MQGEDKQDIVYKTRARLNDVQGVQRLLGRIANDMLQQRISIHRGKSVAYILNIMIGGFEKSDIEKRIVELEQVVKEDEQKF